MPRGQQAPLDERLKQAKAKVDKTKKAYEEAKAKWDKLVAEENTIMLQEVAQLAKAANMSVGDYLKSHLMTESVTVELKKANAE